MSPSSSCSTSHSGMAMPRPRPKPTPTPTSRSLVSPRSSHTPSFPSSHPSHPTAASLSSLSFRHQQLGPDDDMLPTGTSVDTQDDEKDTSQQLLTSNASSMDYDDINNNSININMSNTLLENTVGTRLLGPKLQSLSATATSRKTATKKSAIPSQLNVDDSIAAPLIAALSSAENKELPFKDLQKLFPHVSAGTLMSELNTLHDAALLGMRQMKKEKIIKFILFENQTESDMYKKMSPRARSVFLEIRAMKERGISLTMLQKYLDFPKDLITAALEELITNGVIQSTKTKSGAKYFLASVTVSDTLSGGTWFKDGKLNENLVKRATLQVLTIIREATMEEEQYVSMLGALNHAISVTDIHQQLVMPDVSLKVLDVQVIVDALVLDGRIERVMYPWRASDDQPAPRFYRALRSRSKTTVFGRHPEALDDAVPESTDNDPTLLNNGHYYLGDGPLCDIVYNADTQKFEQAGRVLPSRKRRWLSSNNSDDSDGDDDDDDDDTDHRRVPSVITFDADPVVPVNFDSDGCAVSSPAMPSTTTTTTTATTAASTKKSNRWGSSAAGVALAPQRMAQEAKMLKLSEQAQSRQYSKNGLTTTPCGVCPVRDKCHPDGAINPVTCVYMTTWLEF